MSEWREYILEELTDNFDAIRVPVKQRDRRRGPYPYYGASGVVDHIDDFLFDGEYLLISEDGENLRTRNTPIAFLASGKFWVNNHAHIVRGNSRADTRFLNYALSQVDVSGYLTGSTMPKLTQANMNRIPLVAPPLAEQRAIVRVLGTLDDKIELNRRMNETLEAMARALFRSWFVDFEPVRAKMEGRWRPGESLPGLPAHLHPLFPDRLVPSELGDIPEGWEVQDYGDAVEVIGGGTPKTSVPGYWDGEIPWFSVVDAPEDSDVWVLDTAKQVTRLGVENSSTRILPTGTTIISARGTVGRIALVGVPMAMNQSCYGLRSAISPEGVYCYYSVRQIVTLLQQRSHGSVFDTITRRTLDSLRVVGPPAGVVEAFERQALPPLERIRQQLVESRALRAQRDALLPELVSGRLRVGQIGHSLETLD